MLKRNLYIANHLFILRLQRVTYVCAIMAKRRRALSHVREYRTFELMRNTFFFLSFASGLVFFFLLFLLSRSRCLYIYIYIFVRMFYKLLYMYMFKYRNYTRNNTRAVLYELYTTKCNCKLQSCDFWP